MRNRFFWLLITIMMCGAVMTGLTSCSDCDDSSDHQKKVAVLLPDASSLARWAIDKSNLETVMAMYDFKTSFYLAPETPDGAVQQVDQLKKAINDGVKYIVLTAVDYKKINESGLLEQHPDVKVVCHDHRQEPEGHGV